MEAKINKIYEVIANKELSFGCIFYPNNDNYKDACIYISYDECFNIRLHCVENLENDYGNGIRKVIGHPVMIGDVLDWIEKNNQNYTNFELEVKSLKCLRKRKYKDKPIEEQSEETIDFIYSLIE